MSNIVEFRKVLTDSDMVNGVAKLDGSTSLASPLQLPVSGIAKMQVCSIQISDLIPNIFNANPTYEFNNTMCRIFTNLLPVLPAYTVVIPRGRYSTVNEIADAINAAINLNLHWWLSDTDPGLAINSNPITNQVIVSIDSSKLNPIYGNSFRIDFRKTTSGSDLATTLGFSQGTAYMVGSPLFVSEFTSNQEVKMDTQGTTCDIHSSLVTIRRRNDQYVRTMAMVPFAGKNTLSDNVWPSAGQVSPILIYEGSKTITYFTIEVKTLEGKPMLFMGGALHLVITFIY